MTTATASTALQRAAADAAALAVQTEKATQKRDRLIRMKRQEGRSLRDIAQEAGLSHTMIQKICDRT